MNNIIYLDAAASALKPESVIQAELIFYRTTMQTQGGGFVHGPVMWTIWLQMRVRALHGL